MMSEFQLHIGSDPPPWVPRGGSEPQDPHGSHRLGPSGAVFDWWRRHPAGVRYGWASRSHADQSGSAAALAVGLVQPAFLRGERAEFLELVALWNDFEGGSGLGRARPVRSLGERFASELGGHAPDLFPVFYGVPNRRAHRLGRRSLGFEILRSENRLEAALDRLEPPGSGSSAVEIEEVERFPEDVLELFQRFAQGREALLVRDAQRLDWRFVDHPERRYSVALARRGGVLAGYVVVRADGGAELPAGGQAWEGRPSLLIADWLVPTDDSEASAALLTWAGARARSASLEHIATSVPTKSPEWLRFQKAGFRVFGAHDYVAFRSFQRPYIMSWLFEHWYATLGDDQRG